MHDYPNPRVGVCPCCDDPANSSFLQTIYGNGLFAILSERGTYNRDALFCSTCIAWAKSEAFARQTQREQPKAYNPGNTSPNLDELEQDISQLSDYQRPMVRSPRRDLLSLNLTPIYVVPVSSPVEELADQGYGAQAEGENKLDNEMVIESPDEPSNDEREFDV